MIIKNIDAPKHLEEKVADLQLESFITNLVSPLEEDFMYHFHREYEERHYHDDYYLEKLLSELLKPNKYGSHYMSIMRHIYRLCHYPFCIEITPIILELIPINLRESKPEKDHGENSIIDPMGAYFPNRQEKRPFIEMYLNEIEEASNGDDLHFKWLFTEVLLHELAHAAMDIPFFHNRPCISYYSEFGRWMEESMANAFALRIIRDYGAADFYEYAKQFMLSQPDEYALGVLMVDFDIYDFHHSVDIKRRGADYRLKEIWLEYVKGTPDWNGLHRWNELLSCQYVHYFNGKYYNSLRSIFIGDIIDAVLSDYEKKTGDKMTINAFSKIFPYLKLNDDGERAYEYTDKVVGNRSYEKIITLKDGSLSLYDSYWGEENLQKFLSKARVEYESYRNC